MLLEKEMQELKMNSVRLMPGHPLVLLSIEPADDVVNEYKTNHYFEHWNGGMAKVKQERSNRTRTPRARYF